LQASTQNRI